MLLLMPKLPPMSEGTIKRSLFSSTSRALAATACMLNGPMKFEWTVNIPVMASKSAMTA